jgi:hypothetical protein
VEIAWPLSRSLPGRGARSPAVVVFGACAFTLLLGSLAVLWRLAPVRMGRPGAEETAERLVRLSFT